jgi:protein-arginine deiminase
MRTPNLSWLGITLLALPTACGSDPAGSTRVIDLRADVNRDGLVVDKEANDESDDQAEETWDSQHGAVFLANLDDDERVCPAQVSDAELEACHDAADDRINGEDDLLDLAPLFVRAWPEAPDDASATVEIGEPGAAYVRLFQRTGRAESAADYGVYPPTKRLSAVELRAGVVLAIEGKDIVRDRDRWDGTVDLTLRVQDGTEPLGQDTVRLRLAPVILRHHLDPAETVYFTRVDGREQNEFRETLNKAVSGSGVAQVVSLDAFNDQWTQDFFETAYMSMPSKTGMHVLSVNLRSANVTWEDTDNPQRLAGRIVFTDLRGKDSVGISAVDLNHDPEMDTLNSMGNTETIPPYADYPLGRILRGSTPSYYPDRTFSTLLESQAVQPPVYLDTSWLTVGHIDETITFVKANTPRGWALAVNDAKLARSMLEAEVEAGHGDTVMFQGQSWLSERGQELPAQTTLAEVLGDERIMSASAEATIEVERQLAILKKETGITDAEILHVPFLHAPSFGGSFAYQVGTVNGVSLTETSFGVPDPHGPVINGKDLFKEHMENEFRKVGVTLHWIEDWDLYHRLLGEVHCATNVTRRVPVNTKWWEGAR